MIYSRHMVMSLNSLLNESMIFPGFDQTNYRVIEIENGINSSPLFFLPTTIKFKFRRILELMPNGRI